MPICIRELPGPAITVWTSSMKSWSAGMHFVSLKCTTPLMVTLLGFGLTKNLGSKFISCSPSSESQSIAKIVCLNFLADGNNTKYFSYKRRNIPEEKKILKFNGGVVNGSHVMSPPAMTNLGPLSLPWQKQSCWDRSLRIKASWDLIIQQIFIEYLLRAWLCARHFVQNISRSSQSPYDAVTLSGSGQSFHKTIALRRHNVFPCLLVYLRNITLSLQNANQIWSQYGVVKSGHTGHTVHPQATDCLLLVGEVITYQCWHCCRFLL